MACSARDEIHIPVKYYYLQSEVQFNQSDGVIGAEIQEAKGIESNYTQLLRIYLTGPSSNAYRSPFPRDIHLVSLVFEGDILVITLSNNFADLSGRDLTLACVCLGMTAMEITNTQSVKIRTESLPLDGKASITINSDSIQIIDDHKQYIENIEK